jgi:peptidoglycan/LPS O-acetylase OafA/YrhL
MLAYVGAFSYGVYLLHQPYVLYFGERLRDLPMLAASLVGCVIIAAITICTIPLERHVNQLANRVLDKKKESSLLSAISQKQAATGH